MREEFDENFIEKMKLISTKNEKEGQAQTVHRLDQISNAFIIWNLNTNRFARREICKICTQKYQNFQNRNKIGQRFDEIVGVRLGEQKNEGGSCSFKWMGPGVRTPPRLGRGHSYPCPKQIATLPSIPENIFVCSVFIHKKAEEAWIQQ